MNNNLKKYKTGQLIKFWSERVFGVPVEAIILSVGYKYLKVRVYYSFSYVKDVKINPSRILD